jgi:23S rRNA (adenine2503-C2)-methyltransferase
MSASVSTESGVEPKSLVHGLSQSELIAFCKQEGHPAYRAGQVWHALYVRRASDWPRVVGIPSGLRDRLAGACSIEPGRVVAASGTPGQTRKLLVEMRDGERIETVLIPAGGRRTVCVSSQAGCRHRCAFCASGQSGFRRNLEAGEMVGQILLAAADWNTAPTHIVWMGVGEPFDNYDACLKAVRIVNDGDGLNVGSRRITISTCGVVPGIARLADEGLQVELSVSLHAVDDKTRSELMPVNRRYPLASLLDACREYVRRTGRIITFEYAMIDGLNDRRADAGKLASLVASVPGRVNLIALNPVAEFKGRASRPGAVTDFMRIVRDAGVNITLRQSKGPGIHAACGQLRACHV